MDTIGKRIEFIKKKRGLNYGTLIDDEGIVKAGAMRMAMIRESDKLLYYVPMIAKKHNVNEHWILTGEGDFEPSDTSNKTSVKDSNNSEKLLWERIKMKDELIVMYKDQIEFYKVQLDELKKKVTELEEK